MEEEFSEQLIIDTDKIYEKIDLKINRLNRI